MKSLIEIRRLELETATPGHVFIDGRFFCHSLELPNLDNEPGRSCIPYGHYRLIPNDTGRWRHWEIRGHGVGPGLHRSAIETHPANDVDDLLGCIAQGFTLHCTQRGATLGRSREAVRLFDEELNREECLQLDMHHDLLIRPL